MRAPGKWPDTDLSFRLDTAMYLTCLALVCLVPPFALWHSHFLAGIRDWGRREGKWTIGGVHLAFQVSSISAPFFTPLSLPSVPSAPSRDHLFVLPPWWISGLPLVAFLWFSCSTLCPPACQLFSSLPIPYPSLWPWLVQGLGVAVHRVL